MNLLDERLGDDVGQEPPLSTGGSDRAGDQIRTGDLSPWEMPAGLLHRTQLLVVAEIWPGSRGSVQSKVTVRLPSA